MPRTIRCGEADSGPLNRKATAGSELLCRHVERPQENLAICPRGDGVITLEQSET